MRTCDTCNIEKAESHFRKAGRGRKATCMACEGRADGEQKLAARDAPAPVKPNGHLEVAAGLGLRASIEDGQLCLEQDRPDEDGTIYTHTLTLARHEAAQLIDWVSEHVTRELPA